MPTSEHRAAPNKPHQPTQRPRPASEIVRLAESARARASQNESVGNIFRGLDRPDTREDAGAALAYALWQIQAELTAYDMGDRSVPHRARLLRQQRILQITSARIEDACRKARDRRLGQVSRARSAPNHLSAMVMQHLGGLAFQKILRDVLANRGLPADALHIPGVPTYKWATANGLIGESDLSPRERGFLEVSDKTFVQRMLYDAAAPGRIPDHAAIAERRIELGESVELQALHKIGLAEEATSSILPNRRTSLHFQNLKRAYETRGMIALRQRQSEALAAELQLKIKRLSRSPGFMELRAECLQEAAAIAAEQDQDLWAAVLAEVIKHQRDCPEARKSFPCADCAAGLAKAIRTSRAPAAAPRPTPTAPVSTSGSQPAKAPREEPPPKRKIREGAVVVAVDMRSQPQTTLVGLAWVTDDGQVGVSTDHAASPREGQLLAICRAVIDLYEPGLPIDVLCSDAKAAHAARQLLSQQKGESPAICAELPSAAPLLERLIGGDDRVRVIHDDRQRSEAHGEAAVELAALALRVVRGRSPRQVLEDQITAISDRLSVTKGSRFSGPEDDGVAESRVIRQGHGAMKWTQVLQEDHLASRLFPVPLEVRHSMETAFRAIDRVPVTVYHRAESTPSGKAVRSGRFGDPDTGLSLSPEGWPRDFFPGIEIVCAWEPSRRLLTAKTLRLGTPVLMGDQVLTHYYDTRLLVRNTAPGGKGSVPADRDLSVEQWVLRTMQILGYLDPDGQAVLAEEALERNMTSLGFAVGRLHLVRRTVDNLIHDGHLRRVTGSIGPSGYPIYPASPYRTPVELLSYQPKTSKAQPERPTAHPEHNGPARRGHFISGFVRRLPYGQQASAGATDAHAEAQRRAELANDGPLQPGYTFVQRHRRGSEHP